MEWVTASPGQHGARFDSVLAHVIYEAIEKGDPVCAEGMIREHSHTMAEYIQTFEKRDESLTIADLVTCHAAENDPNQD